MVCYVQTLDLDNVWIALHKLAQESMDCPRPNQHAVHGKGDSQRPIKIPKPLLLVAPDIVLHKA